MTAQTFIFVHDQQIVLDYIAADKFRQLPDVKYCFLGHRDVDQIEHLPNVIIARNLPNNIEHLPNLVAWTGWYAVLHNDLIYADLVNLFEYDVNVVGEWEQPNEPCGYFSHPTADEIWWNYNGIRPALLCLFEFIENTNFTDAVNLPMTSNYTLTKEDALSFVWLLLYSQERERIDFSDIQTGHITERFASFLYTYLSINKGRLTHLYADSHGTQGRGDRYQQIKSQLL
jgi:hypothetical protein